MAEPSISIKEAAILLNGSTTKLRRLVEEGELRAHWYGREYRIYTSSITDYQRRNEIEPKKKETAPERKIHYSKVRDVSRRLNSLGLL